MSDRVIFVDMDGVLANFVEGVKKLFGQPDAVVDRYGIHLAIGEHVDGFWDRINEATGKGFWRDLEPLPDAMDLLMALDEITPEVYILSTPPEDSRAATQKLEWLRQHFPRHASKYILTRYKHLLAGCRRYLIDDHRRNIEAFKSAGGMGILYAAEYNPDGFNWRQAVELIKVGVTEVGGDSDE